MPSLQVSSDPATLTARQCFALIALIYPGGCGFDYKRRSVAELRAFLGAVHATYPAQYDAAVQAFLASHAPVQVPAPVAPPAPAPAAIMAPPAAPTPAPAVAPPAAPAVVAPADPAPIVAPVAAAVAATLPPAVPSAPTVMPQHVPTVPGTTITAAQAFPDVAWPAGFDAAACALRHYASPHAPVPDPFYVFNPHALMVACIALSQPITLPVWYYGDKGTGKTELVQNIAARLGRPFVRIQCDRNLERAEFIGADGLDAGSTQWRDGAMLAGCRVPGAIILLDEPSYLSQGNVSVLNGMLELRAPRTFRTTAGELVQFAPDVGFFAADNTNGAGDESGQFIGTHALNPATCERFLYFVRCDYLAPKVEAKVLRKKTGAPHDRCMGIANVMQACRQKAASGHIPSAPSMRGAVSFLIAVGAGVAPSDAFEVAVTGRAAPEAQEELRALFSAHWPAALTPGAIAQGGASPFAVPAPDLGEKF